MLEIKRKMNIDLNWDRNLNLSDWEYIEVDEKSDSKFKVIQLELSSLGLKGEIPKEIGKLINLKELWLSFNELTGEIPKEIGKLINLQYLFLYS